MLLLHSRIRYSSCLSCILLFRHPPLSSFPLLFMKRGRGLSFLFLEQYAAFSPQMGNQAFFLSLVLTLCWSFKCTFCFICICTLWYKTAESITFFFQVDNWTHHGKGEPFLIRGISNIETLGPHKVEWTSNNPRP